MKRTSTTLLFLLFFGGLGLIWWGEFTKAPTAVDRARLADVVLPELDQVRIDEVHRVEIAGGPDRIVMERGLAGAWQMIEPVRTAASRVSAESLVRGLVLLKRLPMSGSLNGALAPFGLEEPSRTIQLFLAESDKPLATLDLGKSIEGGRYVRRRSDGTVMIVDAKLVGLADASAKSWRESTLFQASTFQVEKAEIAGLGRHLELERIGGRWILTQPFHALADQPKAEAITAELLSLRVANENAYIADDVTDFAPFGLDTPTLTLSIKTSKGLRQRVHIGNAAPHREGATSDEFYARRADLDEVILLRSASLKQLGVEPSTLRSSKLADFEAKTIEFLQIEESGRRTLLQRRKSGWVILEPTSGPAESADVEKFANALVELQASEILEPSKIENSGLESPQWSIKAWTSRNNASSVSLPESPADLAIQLGRSDAALKSIFARIPGDPMILAVPSTLIEFLSSGGVAFRPRSLLNDDPHKIRRLTIRRPDGIFILDSTPGKTPADPTVWTMVAPAAGPGDPVVVPNLAKAIATLHADRLIADRPEDDDREGLNKAILYINWRVEGRKEGESSEHRLRVGAPVKGQKDGARYARVDDQQTVFSLGESFLRLFDQELRDRRPFGSGFTSNRVAKIQIDWPGRYRTLTFLRVPDPLGGPPSWKPVGADPGTFDTRRLNSLVGELSGLQTSRFVQYQGEFAPYLGLTLPRVSIRITLEGPHSEYLLRLGSTSPAAPDKFAATLERTDDGSAFLLPVDPWRQLLEAPELPGDLPVPVFAEEGP